MFRAFEQIFEAIDTSENMKYLVHASYLEIYNEEIRSWWPEMKRILTIMIIWYWSAIKDIDWDDDDVRDLLGNDIKKKLDLKEHPDQGVYVQSKCCWKLSLSGIQTDNRSKVIKPVHLLQHCRHLASCGAKYARVRRTDGEGLGEQVNCQMSLFIQNLINFDTKSENGAIHVVSQGHWCYKDERRLFKVLKSHLNFPFYSFKINCKIQSRSHSIFTINIEMMATGAGDSSHIRKVSSRSFYLIN